MVEAARVTHRVRTIRGGVTFFHKEGGPITNTLGRLGSIPVNLGLLTPEAIFQSPTVENSIYMEKQLHNVPLESQYNVYLGHSPLWQQMGRLFSKERRTNLFSRVAFGIVRTAGTWLGGKLVRYDAYNPYTETAQVYHPSKAILAREVGRIIDFDSAKHSSWKAFFDQWPIARSVYKWRASRNAIKHLRAEDRKDAEKILQTAFGYDLGLYISGGGALLGLVAGHIHSRASENSLFYNGKTADTQQIAPTPLIPSPQTTAIAA